MKVEQPVKEKQIKRQVRRKRKVGCRSFRPFESSVTLANGICAATGLSQANLFALVIQAGLIAINEKQKGAVPLPLKFKLDDDVSIAIAVDPFVVPIIRSVTAA